MSVFINFDSKNKRYSQQCYFNSNLSMVEVLIQIKTMDKKLYKKILNYKLKKIEKKL